METFNWNVQLRTIVSCPCSRLLRHRVPLLSDGFFGRVPHHPPRRTVGGFTFSPLHSRARKGEVAPPAKTTGMQTARLRGFACPEVSRREPPPPLLGAITLHARSNHLPSFFEPFTYISLAERSDAAGDVVGPARGSKRCSSTGKSEPVDAHDFVGLALVANSLCRGQERRTMRG